MLVTETVEEIEKNLYTGAKFSSYNDLSKAVEWYQNENFIQLYRRDSRNIEATLKRAPNRKFNPEIKYSELVYSCIHGGKKFKSESKGKRPHQQ